MVDLTSYSLFTRIRVEKETGDRKAGRAEKKGRRREKADK